MTTSSNRNRSATDAPVESPAPVEKPTTGDESAPALLDAPATEAPAQSDPDKVTLKLAHPLDRAEDLRYLGLEPKEGGYKVGEKITVNRAGAQSVINAGYGQVDPEDKAAVAAILNPGA